MVLFLYLGYVLVELAMTTRMFFAVERIMGNAEFWDAAPILYSLDLIFPVLYLVPYAIARHYSKQQARPWWAFLLIGVAIALLELLFVHLYTQAVQFPRRFSFSMLLPFVAFFAVAWLPLGRAKKRSHFAN